MSIPSDADVVESVSSDLRRDTAAELVPRPPAPGERAAGHGVGGVIAGVADRQPLAGDDIWRVTLAGEACGRLVGRGRAGTWRLLQLDELTDAQLEAFDADVSERSTTG